MRSAPPSREDEWLGHVHHTREKPPVGLPRGHIAPSVSCPGLAVERQLDVSIFGRYPSRIVPKNIPRWGRSPVSRPTSHRVPSEPSRRVDVGPGWAGPVESDLRIRAVLEGVRLNCGGPLTVRGVAASVGLSRSRFEHLFREQTGMCFTKALRDLRLAKAVSLLGDPNRRVKEAAGLCGYSSTASFSKAFRRGFGRAPSYYRRSTFGQQIAHPDTGLKLTA
jgi:AraC-like DNA-binding protein